MYSRGGTINKTTEWQALEQHFLSMRNRSLSDLLSENPNRFDDYNLSAAGMLVDYSNTHCDSKTLALLLKLAEKAKLHDAIDALLTGKAANVTEEAPALHTLLRHFSDTQLLPPEKQHLLAQIEAVWDKMAIIVNAIRAGTYLGFSGKPIKNIVSIGIGGSQLGPKMVLEALTANYPNLPLNFYFVANLDRSEMNNCLTQCSPEETLFIICSKSFTTRETLINLEEAIAWMRVEHNDAEALSQHFIAVTTAQADPLFKKLLGDPSIAINTVSFGNWMSGRYSVWSAIGLSIAIAIGMSEFKSFLQGAHQMDQHFKTTELLSNIPVILGLLGIWYNNFFHFTSQAIVPYYQGLSLLPTYLQQLHMESLGKRIAANGSIVDYATGGLVWGGVATNSQHSFHQLLLQGTPIIPTDFILPLRIPNIEASCHDEMIANCLAQSDLFSFGNSKSHDHRSHHYIPGNRPHQIIMLEEMDARSLGALLALYEHKVYVQSVIWQINPFDQWGVQQGKTLAKNILQQLRYAPNNPRIKRIAEKLYE